MTENIRGGAATEEDEKEQFYMLISREKHRLYGIAFSYFHNEAEALEVLQETVCRAWQKRESVNDTRKFMFWLMRMMLDSCNDTLKRGGRKAGKQLEYSEERITVMKSGCRLDLEQALDGVNDNCRQVLVLKYSQKLTLSEIAGILDKPEATITAWLNNGLQQIRDKCGGTGSVLMAEAEEKLLGDYFQELAGVTADVPEIKLEMAIHNGIAEGRHGRPVRRKRYSTVIAAVIAVILFASMAWIYGQSKGGPESPPPQSWGGLEVYREAIGDNLTVTSALDAGYVQHVNIESPEVGGFQFTIDGVIADRRGVILLYTLENSTDQQYVNMKFSFKADEHSSDYLTADGSYFYSGYHNYKPGGQTGISRDVMIIPWRNLQTLLPDRVFATLTLLPMDDNQQIYQDDSGEVTMYKLDAAIDLDENADYSEGDEVVLEEGFNIAGYPFNIKDLYLGPTGIYMSTGYEGEELDVYGEYGFGMVMGTGKHEKALSKAGDFTSSDSKIYYIFHNDSMRPRDPVRMDIEGLYAIEKSKLNLIVNSETREIIQAPDERLAFSDQMDHAEPGTIILDMTTQVKESEDSADVGSFALDSTFLDGEGTWHWLVNPEAPDAAVDWDQRSENDKVIITASFNPRIENLPQPLTFKLTYYPGLILGDDRIRIR